MATIFVGSEIDLADIAEELHTLAERFFRLDQADRNLIMDTIEAKLGQGTMAEVFTADLFAPITVRAASKSNGNSALTTKEGGGPVADPRLADALELVEKLSEGRAQ